MRTSLIAKTALLLGTLIAISALLGTSLIFNEALAVKPKVITWQGGGDGTHWSDPRNWKGNSVPSSNDIIEIDGKKTNVIVHLDIDFTLAAPGILTIDSGDQLVIDQGKLLTNQGVIDNNSLFFACNIAPTCGGINNNGTIINWATINNDGAIAPGDLVNTGIMNNNGLIYVPIRGNHGGFNSVQNIVNSGTFNNFGTLSIDIDNQIGGILSNNGLIDSLRTNMGTINNLTGSFIINFVTLTNYSGAVIDNFGSIDNRSGGIIDNGGTITNECGSTIINSGQVIGNQPVVVTC